jgi:hypothetical protein
MLSLDADIVKRVSRKGKKCRDYRFDLACGTLSILRNMGSDTTDWCIEIFNLVWQCNWID